jgi:maleylacetoacetate isomerase
LLAVASITLYSYWRSSCSYRVRIALAIKGVTHDVVPVNILQGEQHAVANKARNPMGHVPCLLVDGKPVTESVAIIELLEDLFPNPPLYPKDPMARARVRTLVEHVASGIQPLQNLAVLNKVAETQEGRWAWAKYWVERGMTALEALLVQFDAERLAAGRSGPFGPAGAVKGPFAFGEVLTAADVLIVPQVYAARRFGVDMAAYPRVLEVTSAAELLPAFASAVPERQVDAPKS